MRGFKPSCPDQVQPFFLNVDPDPTITPASGLATLVITPGYLWPQFNNSPTNPAGVKCKLFPLRLEILQLKSQAPFKYNRTDPKPKRKM